MAFLVLTTWQPCLVFFPNPITCWDDPVDASLSRLRLPNRVRSRALDHPVVQPGAGRVGQDAPLG